jgi:ParB family chromosome partitioning protein
MILQIHDLANVFPRMPNDEFAALKADIKTNGLLEPIWLYDGKVLDGRHRYFACQEIGVEPAFRDYKGGDPRGFVVSLNLKRRHLDATQRSAVAAELANMPQGNPTGNNQYERKDANLHVSSVTREEAATLLNVSPRSVATASKVKDESPEIFAAMKSGDISAHLAAQVIDLPREERDVVEAAAPEQMKEVAREVIHNHRAQGTGENEWYTPEQYVEAARAMMGGIDLDPASSELAQKTVRAGEFFTIDDDGLTREWRGRVWLNPPYAQPAIHHFMQKTVDEYASGRVTECIALTHNYTDTQWFHIAAKEAAAICFTRGRIGFVNPEGKKAAPTQGQAFFYFGNRCAEFAEAFGGFGFVMVRS